MNFKEYLSTHGSVTKLSKDTGLSRSEISMFKHGKRSIPAHAAVAIEKATNGQVSRKDLRPNDWEKLWPDLAAT